MLEKRNSQCIIGVNMFFWCTICAIPLLILSYPLAMGCLAFGANSLYICLCYGGFEENMVIVRICGVWMISFLVLIIPTYILAIKKRCYIPFLILVLGDTLFVCLSAVLELSRDNLHGFGMIMPDLIVSIVFCVIMIFSVHFFRKEAKTDRRAISNQ